MHPLFLALLVALALPAFGQTAPRPVPETGGLDFSQWRMLAIQEGGRRKPVDTFAREALTKISGRSTYRLTGGRRWSANDFLLSALLETRNWKNEPLVLVSLGELVERLGLPKSQRRFSFTELSGSAELQKLAAEVHALQRAEQPLNRLQTEVSLVSARLTLLNRILDGSALLIVPAAQNVTDPWVVPPAFGEYYSAEQFAGAETALQALAFGYLQGDRSQFARSAAELRSALRALSPAIYPTERQLKLEVRYHDFDGFYRAAWAYGLALLLFAFAAFMRGSSVLRNLAVGFALGGLLFHGTAIVLRCLVAGRPPVTNMYESIIWVSFAVALFGMIFFLRTRALVYLFAALPIALVALLLVHQMPVALSASIDPLVPVLRDNFWLTIHVLTITLSYAAFALALGLGHILLWRALRAPVDPALALRLRRVLQLGVLLLAAGTILGGVWANYSWGRFWGWDPKETWALLALLSYLVALHGRLAGWWADFGLVVASVICFLAVLMAWYGVNFLLGKGLHSYGFGAGGEAYVAGFVVLDLLFVALAIWRHGASRPEQVAV